MVGQQTFNTPNINSANNNAQYFVLPASTYDQAKYDMQHQQQQLVPQQAMYPSTLAAPPQHNDQEMQMNWVCQLVPP